MIDFRKMALVKTFAAFCIMMPAVYGLAAEDELDKLLSVEDSLTPKASAPKPIEELPDIKNAAPAEVVKEAPAVPVKQPVTQPEPADFPPVRKPVAQTAPVTAPPVKATVARPAPVTIPPVKKPVAQSAPVTTPPAATTVRKKSSPGSDPKKPPAGSADNSNAGDPEKKTTRVVAPDNNLELLRTELRLREIELARANKEVEQARANKEIEQAKANKEIERLKDIVRRIQEASRRESVVLHYNKAAVYRSSMMYKKAEDEYLAALTVDPNDAAVHYNLAILYDDNLKDKKKAKMHYEKFLELAPDDPDAVRARDWLSSIIE